MLCLIVYVFPTPAFTSIIMPMSIQRYEINKFPHWAKHHFIENT